jgi:hypothetical protein
MSVPGLFPLPSHFFLVFAQDGKMSFGWEQPGFYIKGGSHTRHTFPLTEDGWTSAWEMMSSEYPQLAAKVAAAVERTVQARIAAARVVEPPLPRGSASMNRKARTPETVAPSVILMAIGFVLFVVGAVLKNHFQMNAAICNTFGGANVSCLGNEGAFTAGRYLQPLGGLMVGVGAIMGLLFLIGKPAGAKGHLTVSGSSAQRVPVRQEPVRSVASSAPGWVPPLPSQQWAEALKAAANQPYPRSQYLEAAIRNASHRGGLRAWLFGFGEKEQTLLVLIFADRIMTVECRDSGESNKSAFPDVDQIPVQIHRDVESSISDLAIAGARILRPEPPGALEDFVKVVAQFPWIAVTEDSGISTAGSAPALAPAVAPPPAPVVAPPVSIADELAKLARLKVDGVLTEEEFAAQKAKLLS